MATDAQLLTAYQRTGNHAAVAREFGLSEAGVRGRVSREQRRKREAAEAYSSRGLFAIVTARKLDVPKITLMPMIEADELVVTGDWHVPTANWEFMDTMCEFGTRHMRRGKRVLAIVGDLFNFDGLSKYEHTSSPYSLEHELSAAETTLDYVMRVYDRVYFGMGNHDERFTKMLSGALGIDRLLNMFTRHLQAGKLIATDLRQMETVSGGVHWRLTHQRNYSKNKGIVAARLCLKHQTNVISHHEHHVGIGRDDFDRYTWINNGMLGDADKMRYVRGTDSTANEMCTGFTFLRGGTGHLLTPYPTITDWDMWRMGNQVSNILRSAA